MATIPPAFRPSKSFGRYKRLSKKMAKSAAEDPAEDFGKLTPEPPKYTVALPHRHQP